MGSRLKTPRFRLMAEVRSSSGVQPLRRAASPAAWPMRMGPSMERTEILPCSIFCTSSRISREAFLFSCSERWSAAGKGRLVTFMGMLPMPMRYRLLDRVPAEPLKSFGFRSAANGDGDWLVLGTSRAFPPWRRERARACHPPPEFRRHRAGPPCPPACRGLNQSRRRRALGRPSRRIRSDRRRMAQARWSFVSSWPPRLTVTSKGWPGFSASRVSTCSQLGF